MNASWGLHARFAGELQTSTLRHLFPQAKPFYYLQNSGARALEHLIFDRLFGVSRREGTITPKT
jgi:hypothetical protein